MSGSAPRATPLAQGRALYSVVRVAISQLFKATSHSGPHLSRPCRHHAAAPAKRAERWKRASRYGPIPVLAPCRRPQGARGAGRMRANGSKTALGVGRRADLHQRGERGGGIWHYDNAACRRAIGQCCGARLRLASWYLMRNGCSSGAGWRGGQLEILRSCKTLSLANGRLSPYNTVNSETGNAASCRSTYTIRQIVTRESRQFADWSDCAQSCAGR